MKKTLYGLLMGVMTLGGILTITPVLAQTNTNTDWTQPSADMVTGREDAGSQLLDTVKTVINWLLGMLATIALVICLRGGFQMVTAAGDENKFKNGQRVLKHAAIGLAIILLAWLIVSVVFWFVINV